MKSRKEEVRQADTANLIKGASLLMTGSLLASCATTDWSFLIRQLLLGTGVVLCILGIPFLKRFYKEVKDFREYVPAWDKGRGIFDRMALQLNHWYEKEEEPVSCDGDTLYYLKKGGRITPAAAALGTLLKLNPVLQIQGEKLDAFAKARTVKQAKNLMIEAMKHDFAERFHDPEGKSMYLEMAYTYDLDAAEAFKQEVQEAFPGLEIHMDPLSLSVSCHIGPGALAVACSKKIPELEA